jgi:hypothetical protein
MKIWVDADRTPRSAREIVRRAAERLEIDVRFVKDGDVESSTDDGSGRLPLVLGAESGDVVITADPATGAELARRGIVAIDPRGARYTAAPRGQTPEARDLVASIRSLEVGARGSPPYDERAKREFAATLDRILARPETRPRDSGDC